MIIDREALVRKYNPHLDNVDLNSPLTLGNGSFAFTADVTGFQTLFDDYKEACPLLTMADWGWHTIPSENGERYTLSDLEMTEYRQGDRPVSYPVEATSENKKVYKWLRENPHRLNLARVRLLLDGEVVSKEQITGIDQTLDMYTGVLYSKFKLCEKEVSVTTAVGKSDTVGFKIESALCRDRLEIMVDFPYGSPDKTASDFEAKEKHITKHANKTMLNILERQLDDTKYYCLVNADGGIKETGDHRYVISGRDGANITLTLSFAKEKDEVSPVAFKQVLEEAKVRYYTLWTMGAMIDVTGSEDKRANELERRIITSMYLCFTEDFGATPPQETGLTCNSWYGKFHLEMHPIHAAFACLYGRGHLLEKSLDWYLDILPEAMENAKRNGYAGARWPKMTDPSGCDSPSPIAPLLVWQQPHIIYMLEMLRLSRYRDDRVEVPKVKEEDFLYKYKDVVRKTAEFMADFVVYNRLKDKYELLPPLYSVQEKGNPLKIKNPPFECAYFSFGLRIAYEWLERLGECHTKWLEIAEKMAGPSVKLGRYQAYEGCSTTYTSLNMDHPSMIYQYGWLSDKYDKKVLDASIKDFMNHWDFESLWGWDFALLAMVLAKEGRMEDAFDMLLFDTPKNRYVTSGNNAQSQNSALPLYLPGNGALLLAMTVLKSCKGWYVKTEGIMNYPF